MVLDPRDKSSALHQAKQDLILAHETLFQVYKSSKELLTNLAMFEDDGDDELRDLWAEFKGFLEDTLDESEEMVDWNCNIIKIMERMEQIVSGEIDKIPPEFLQPKIDSHPTDWYYMGPVRGRELSERCECLEEKLNGMKYERDQYLRARSDRALLSSICRENKIKIENKIKVLKWQKKSQ